MKIVPLCENTEYLDLVAGWTFSEFCLIDRPSVSLNAVKQKLHAQKPGNLPFTYIALVDDICVGTVAIYDNDLKGEGVTPWLGSLFVHPDWRGKKIGQALIAHIKVIVAAWGYDTLYLRTEHTAEYYEKLAWNMVKKTVDPIYGLDTTVYKTSLQSCKPYSVEQIPNDQWMSYRLSDKKNGTSATVAVARGGILTSFFAVGQEVMYLEENTLHDIQKSVRGGCPILFPSCGRLRDKQYTYNGNIYHMNIHGVARNHEWQALECDERDAASLKIVLYSDARTKEEYPFDFKLIYTYYLEGDTLSIEQEICNLSDEQMPFSSGLHPYFKINRNYAKVRLDASEYLEVNDDFSKHSYDGITAFTDGVECIAQKLTSTRAVLNTALGYHITLDCEGDYQYFVLWSPEGTQFACVEPWTACPDALNTKKDLLWLNAGESTKFCMKITVSMESES